MKQHRQYKGFDITATRGNGRWAHQRYADFEVKDAAGAVVATGLQYWTIGDAFEVGRCKVDQLTNTPQEPWTIDDNGDDEHDNWTCY